MFAVDQAFISSFVNADFGLPIAHENRDYTPVQGTAYAEILVLQNDKTPWSVEDVDESDGVFRVILRYPSGQGVGAVKNKADEIIDNYKNGSEITHNGQTVKIISVNRAVGVQETGWYKMMVDIRYKTFFGR